MTTKMPAKNIIFFDGICHLCNGYINFLVRLNSNKNIFYSTLQGKHAAIHLTEVQIKELNSIIYLKYNFILIKSDAVIESLYDSNRLFFWIKILKLIPLVVRDFIYDFIAKNRYSLFGKNESCRIPTAQEREYLLD